MQLRRHRSPPRLISLVSMVDVLLIMLVFFMVTSTYLNLDMIPMAEAADDNTLVPAGPASPSLMIRLGSDGAPYLRGHQVTYEDLAAMLAALPAGTSVMILPSLRANTQSLVTLMDVATSAGINRLRIVQLAAP